MYYVLVEHKMLNTFSVGEHVKNTFHLVKQNSCYIHFTGYEWQILIHYYLLSMTCMCYLHSH